MKVRLPNNGGGGMQDMLRQAQKMQEDMAALQADLEERVYDISAGGGMVKLQINGKRRVLHMEIQPDIVDPDDIETLSDVLVAAVNEAIQKVDDTAAQEMGKITGAMGLAGGMPGLF